MSASPWRILPVARRWCVHAYYTVRPWAPDGSDRILIAGADLDAGTAAPLIIDGAGGVLARGPERPVHAGFWHTGLWQTWSPDARAVYFQAGSLADPRIGRWTPDDGRVEELAGDMEGSPPFGEPILSGLMGLLYAAGYGTLAYRPESAPVPFQAREAHGLFAHRFGAPSRLILSVAEVLERHPRAEALHRAEAAWRRDHGGDGDGLTLMLFCVRWSPDGRRLLFFFGNHLVVGSRREPSITSIFTADRALRELHLAVDLSFGRRGAHWHWCPDGEHLIGYGPDGDGGGPCLARVRYDGTGYRRISAHDSCGHPSLSPADGDLLVTDRYGRPGGVEFIDLRSDTIIHRSSPGHALGTDADAARHPGRVCHHPVFSADGTRVLINTLTGRHAAVAIGPAPCLS